MVPDRSKFDRHGRRLPPRPRVVHPRVHDRPEIHAGDIIGDVHGCYDELAELLGRLGHADMLDPAIPPAEGPPRVIFVGDLVDRGDRIVDTLCLVLRLHRRGHALAVIGNHDERFLRWLVGRKVFVRHGLEETLAEFEKLSAEKREDLRLELIPFLTDLPWALRLDDGHLIVAHAAWHGELFDAPSTDRLRSYTLYGPTTGRTTEEGYPERIDWAPGYQGPELVVFGHQVYDAPYVHKHAIGIDTGCVFGGALSALRYPGLELVSVPSRWTRYRRGGGGRKASGGATRSSS